MKNKIQKRINEIMEIEGIGQALIDSADLIIRMRLGQLNYVADILKKNCTIVQQGRGVDLEEPLYKAVELGELLKCKEEYGDCEYADNCWITRKGFCEKRRKEKEK